tara:strand:- start:292 stop:1593 length:1302 start_codon:yes stop_codon:yes gene_type:complete
MTVISKDNKAPKEIIYYFFVFLLTLTFLMVKPITTDEIEHLHFSYLTGHGLLPFKDYWQHHLPVIWYFFSFIKFVPTFLGKIFSVRLIQTFLWIITVYFLDLSINKKKSISITLILFLSFFAIDFFSFRPEFLCLPFLSYLIYLIDQNKLNHNLPLTLFLFSLFIFVSPRIYFVILPVFIFIVYKEGVFKIIKSIIPALITFLVLGVLFDFRDLYMFVFKITGNWDCEGVYIKGYFWYSILLFNFFCFLISIFQKKWLIVSIYLFLALALFIEKAPFISQSTLFMNFISIYVAFNTLNLFKKLKNLVPIIIIFFVIYNINRNDNLYKYNFIQDQLLVYEKSEIQLENYYVQTDGYRKMQILLNDLTYPIFILDGTYFGFYQKCLLPNSYKEVIDYNLSRNRSVKYFKDDKKIISKNIEVELFYTKIKQFLKNK